MFGQLRTRFAGLWGFRFYLAEPGLQWAKIRLLSEEIFAPDAYIPPPALKRGKAFTCRAYVVGGDWLSYFQTGSGPGQAGGGLPMSQMEKPDRSLALAWI